jgi:protein TonB
MFESATFDSRGALPNQAPRWMLLTFAANLAIVAALIVVPLLYPSVLPYRFLPRTLYVPPAAPASPAQSRPQTARSAPLRPNLTPMPIDIRRIIAFSRPMEGGANSSEPETTGPFFEETTVGGSGAVRPIFETPAQTVKPAPPSIVHVSQGVLDGSIIQKTVPVYPAIARATGTSGTVTLAATISTTGTIENVRVLSGPAMLQRAAADAVRTWRYRPYLLNNQPVEVETTISVVFTLSGH